MKLSIGSGDVNKLLMGKETKGYQELFVKFVTDDLTIYNAVASPIDALRTGAILEDRYLDTLPNNHFIQYKVQSKEMDCLTASIDFAEIKDGEIVDFEELKTIFFTDFIEIINPLREKKESEIISFIKKKFKNNYNQVQHQMHCSGLKSCKLVFLAVLSYDDDINYLREIKENEVFKIRIPRDEKVISQIKERALIFQQIKDNFKTDK